LFALACALTLAGCVSTGERAEVADGNAPDTPVVSFADVRPPARGSQSEAGMQRAAATMKRLAQYPLAEGATRARSAYRNWVQSRDDLRVDLCGSVLQPITEANTPHQGVLVSQYVLSSAAFKIEYPRFSNDAEYVTRAGLNGVVSAYRAIKRHDASVTRPSLERLARAMRGDRVQTYVRIRLLDCRGDA
jgi:hypothetical protein